MGVWAAKSAALFAGAAGLDHAPARLLLWMAIMVLDKPDDERNIPPRHFWAGRESLALGLGFTADRANSTAAQSAVKRALRPLVESGAVELLQLGRFHQRSEYYLRLESEGGCSAKLLPASTHFALPEPPPAPIPPPPPPPPPLPAPYQQTDPPGPQGVGERPPMRRPRTRAERLAARRFTEPSGSSPEVA